MSKTAELGTHTGGLLFSTGSNSRWRVDRRRVFDRFVVVNDASFTSLKS